MAVRFRTTLSLLYSQRTVDSDSSALRVARAPICASSFRNLGTSRSSNAPSFIIEHNPDKLGVDVLDQLNSVLEREDSKEELREVLREVIQVRNDLIIPVLPFERENDRVPGVPYVASAEELHEGLVEVSIGLPESVGEEIESRRITALAIRSQLLVSIDGEVYVWIRPVLRLDELKVIDRIPILKRKRYDITSRKSLIRIDLIAKLSDWHDHLVQGFRRLRRQHLSKIPATNGYASLPKGRDRRSPTCRRQKIGGDLGVGLVA